MTEISIKLHAYQKALTRNVVMRCPLFCPFPFVIISPARLQRRQELFSLCRMWTPIFSVTHTAGPRLFAPLRPPHPPPALTTVVQIHRGASRFSAAHPISRHRSGITTPLPYSLRPCDKVNLCTGATAARERGHDLSSDLFI